MALLDIPWLSNVTYTTMIVCTLNIPYILISATQSSSKLWDARYIDEDVSTMCQNADIGVKSKHVNNCEK